MTSDITAAIAAERRIAFSYAPAGCGPALEALFALDTRLAAIVRDARDPMVGQMRLTWWYEALIALDASAPPAEPVLRSLYADVLPGGVTGADLAVMIDGWERLLDAEPLDDAMMAEHATARGATLFAAAATTCGAEMMQARLGGEGWALADLAGHLRNPAEAARARDLAEGLIAAAFRTRWPRRARALGALALLARFDVMAAPPPRAGPRRVMRLLRHRWNGT